MRYPLLTEIIHAMRRDNYGVGYEATIRPDPEWPINSDELERMASILSPDEKETMIIGEEGEQQKIVERYGIGLLSEFLNEVFDGDLSEGFFTF